MSTESAEYGPVATRKLFENGETRVWEMDLKPTEVCGLHHHTLDYVLFILEGANVGVESPGRRSYTLRAPARATYYVPAGGIESAHNVGQTRFREILFELKRMARPGHQGPGYAASEALVGAAPAPGSRNVLENDRVRVTEVTLAPNGSCRLVNGRFDTVVYVAEGGRVRMRERAHGAPPDASTASEAVLNATEVKWLGHGPVREVTNIGAGQFRAVTVEIKEAAAPH